MANFLYFWDFWGEFCWEGFGATLPELRTLDVVLQMDTRAQINPVSTNQKRETRSENRNSQLLRTEHSRSKFKKFVKLKRLKRLKLNFEDLKMASVLDDLTEILVVRKICPDCEEITCETCVCGETICEMTEKFMGLKFKSITESALEFHEFEECIYRLVPCPLCKTAGEFHKIIQHFESHTEEKLPVEKLGSRFAMALRRDLEDSHDRPEQHLLMDLWNYLKKTFSADSPIHSDTVFRPLVQFNFNNQTFLLAGKMEDKIMYYCVYILGSLNEAKHFRYTLKFFGPNTTNTMEGQVAAIDESDESFQILSKAGKCFAMPYKTFFSQFFECSLEIRNLKEEAMDDNYEPAVSDNDEESKE